MGQKTKRAFVRVFLRVPSKFFSRVFHSVKKWRQAFAIKWMLIKGKLIKEELNKWNLIKQKWELTRRRLSIWNLSKLKWNLPKWKLNLAKRKKWLVLTFLAMSVFSLCTIVSLLGLSAYVRQTTQAQIHKPEQLQGQYQVGLVLGAKVYANGGLSAMTQDRADTAILLYRAHRIQKILVSGDHGRKDYDEVNTIKDYLLRHGIPAQDLFLDHAGFDTYDSIYRAKAIFQVESVVIISQEFHLPRAVFIAQSLGVNAVGAIADRQEYFGAVLQQAYVREGVANAKAVLDIVTHAPPKFLGEVIPITGESRRSWDR